MPGKEKEKENENENESLESAHWSMVTAKDSFFELLGIEETSRPGQQQQQQKQQKQKKRTTVADSFPGSSSGGSTLKPIKSQYRMEYSKTVMDEYYRKIPFLLRFLLYSVCNYSQTTVSELAVFCMHDMMTHRILYKGKALDILSTLESRKAAVLFFYCLLFRIWTPTNGHLIVSILKHVMPLITIKKKLLGNDARGTQLRQQLQPISSLSSSRKNSVAPLFRLKNSQPHHQLPEKSCLIIQDGAILPSKPRNTTKTTTTSATSSTTTTTTPPVISSSSLVTTPPLPPPLPSLKNTSIFGKSRSNLFK
jgi:hypothetical protein